MFEEAWGESESKKKVAETIIHKIFETNCSFDVKQRTTEKFNFYF